MLSTMNSYGDMCGKEFGLTSTSLDADSWRHMLLGAISDEWGGRARMGVRAGIFKTRDARPRDLLYRIAVLATMQDKGCKTKGDPQGISYIL